MNKLLMSTHNPQMNPSQNEVGETDTPRIMTGFKYEDPKKRHIDPMSIVGLDTKPQKLKDTNKPTKSNNILNKTISAVRETIMSEI